MLQRLIPLRATAAVATGMLAAAGAVVLSAPAAQAAEVTWPSTCVNQYLPGLPFESDTKIDVSVDPAKDTYAVGETVTVHWAWKAYSPVPDTDFVDRVDEDSTLPRGTLTLSGAQTGEVSLEGPRINPETMVGDPLIISDMTGSLTLSSAGTIDLTPKGYSTSTMAFGLDATTTCTPTPPATPPTALSLTVDGDGQSTTLNAPDSGVAPGAEVALTGAGFTPNGTPTVELCTSLDTDCQASRFTANSLVIDAEGNLSGSATLAEGLDGATYHVRVSDGTASASDTLQVLPPVGERTLTINPDSGPVGTVITYNGSNWTPDARGSIVGLSATGQVAGDQANFTVDPDGNIAGTYTVSDPETVEIRVREGVSSVNRVIVPFTITDGSQLNQDVTVGLDAGGLSMTQAGSGIDFGAATLNGEPQELNGALNQVTVVDARGGNAGWSLVGTMSDLTAENGTDTIPAGNVAWTPSCAASETSLSPVGTGSPGPLGTTGSTLCSQESDASSATGGRFTADAEMTLTTPEFAAAGSYSGTLTLTLS